MGKNTTKEPEDVKEDEQPKAEEKAKLKAVDNETDEDLEKEEDVKDEVEKEEEFNLTDEEKEEVKKNRARKAKKGSEGSGQSPEQDTASATDDNSSTSPGMGVPSTQNVFVPQSQASVPLGSVAPSESMLQGKSSKVDLRKSPLYVGMSKSIGELQKAIGDKLNAVEKSFNDRIANLSKKLENVEKFYENMPLRKAINENVGQSMQEKLQKGEVRYSG